MEALWLKKGEGPLFCVAAERRGRRKDGGSRREEVVGVLGSRRAVGIRLQPGRVRGLESRNPMC